MLDLHTHVLPGIDDGPRDIEGCVALARAAAAEGVTTLAATPHLRQDYPEVVPDELAARTAAVQAALRDAAILVEIVPGGEVDLYWALRADDEQLRLVSYGQRGRDLLLETPYGELPATFEDLLFQLTARGYRLLLAHPERNRTFQRDPGRLGALVGRGTLLQITAAALVEPSRRSRTRRLAIDLVREGRAHLLASDAHGPAIPRAGLRAGVDAAARLDPRRARWMVTEAPAAVLAGDPLPPAPGAGGGRRWTRLRRYRRG